MAYGTATELARILLLSSPSAAQTTALQRVLDAATIEIDSYLGRAEPFPPDAIPELVTQVAYERAAEHWKTEQSPFGIVATGGESPPAVAARNAWTRHARTLLPLKESWGIA